MAQLVKNLPSMWETWVKSLGWEDPLEKGTITHSSITPVFWPGEFQGLYSPWGHKQSDMTEQLSHTCNQNRSFSVKKAKGTMKTFQLTQNTKRQGSNSTVKGM